MPPALLWRLPEGGQVADCCFVQVGQSFNTFGYGCTSCWGGVGAGNAEVDVIYISFIVSVQHIGYLGITWIIWTTDSRCTVPEI